jgi:hypothetical protein
MCCWGYSGDGKREPQYLRLRLQPLPAFGRFRADRARVMAFEVDDAPIAVVAVLLVAPFTVGELRRAIDLLPAVRFPRC